METHLLKGDRRGAFKEIQDKPWQLLWEKNLDDKIPGTTVWLDPKGAKALNTGLSPLQGRNYLDREPFPEKLRISETERIEPLEDRIKKGKLEPID